MYRRLPAIMAAAQRLAVHRHHFARHFRARPSLNPLDKKALELGRVKGAEKPPERVVARNPMFIGISIYTSLFIENHRLK
jgi:hypothetical protein